MSLEDFFWPPWETLPPEVLLRRMSLVAAHSFDMANSSKLCKRQKNMYASHPCHLRDFVFASDFLGVFSDSLGGNG